jgi:hypothetical protein
VKKALLAALTAFLLLGCATKPKGPPLTARGFDQVLQKSIGQDINRMIAGFGAPQATFLMPNGNTVYTFVHSYTYNEPLHRSPIITFPSTTTYTTSGNTVYANTTPGISVGGNLSGGGQVTKTCKVNFVATPVGKIVSYSFEGDMCVAEEAPSQ